MLQHRVLIVNDMLWGGGRERRISQLIIGLRKDAPVEICLVLLDEGIDYPEVLSAGIRIEIIKRSGNRDLSVFLKLRQIFQSFRPTVALPWSLMSAFYTCPIAYSFGIPSVSAHVVDCNRPKVGSINFMALLFANFFARRIISNSHAGHIAYWTPKSKQVTIRNGFDFARVPQFHSSTSLPKGHSLKDQATIAMIGRMDPQKDFRTYIEALKLLRKTRVDFQAYCIGKGPDLPNLEAAISSGRVPYIHCKGFISPIESFLPSITIGVLCTDSKRHLEGISNVLLEMMAFGIPVIATRGGGTDELISNMVDGILIEPGDTLSLKFWLSRLLDDPDFRDFLRTNAIKKIRQEYSLKQMCDSFLGIFEEVGHE